MKKILMVAALAAMGAGAAPVVEITSVQQQYPWTNTVDITYTSTGIASNNTYYVVFKAQDSAGKEIGVITNDLKVSQGSTWVAQWQPPFNVRYENCTMTPYVYKGGMDDYMIVDLETWKVTFEGMSTQAASNAKYNQGDYKTKKLVFRKIDAGDYIIGDDGTPTAGDYALNTRHTVKIPKPYYMSIFSCTEDQWRRIVGDSTASTALPKASISYNQIRGSAGAGAKPTTGIMANLNAKTKAAGFTNGEGFDLPTESMWEIAARAGVTTRFQSGDTLNGREKYSWVATNSGNTRHEVGTKDPNPWGLYDVHGNVWSHIRDVSRNKTVDLKTITEQCENGLMPITSGRSGYIVMRGGGYSDTPNNAGDSRNWLSNGWYTWTTGQTGGHVGFRIAYIPD